MDASQLPDTPDIMGYLQQVPRARGEEVVLFEYRSLVIVGVVRETLCL